MPQAGSTVIAVSRDAVHAFSKKAEASITLLAGLGVEGDAHSGTTVKHRSRVAKDPAQPNLRQVHLMHAEVFEELAGKGFTVGAGDLGENVTTEGVDLLGLPRGARLHIGETAVVEITGLRNPCKQLEEFQPGLMYALLDKTESGDLIRKAGVMGIVIAGGAVSPGDSIRVEMPAGPHEALLPV